MSPVTLASEARDALSAAQSSIQSLLDAQEQRAARAKIIVGYNSILERYCRGNYLNAERKRKCVEQSGAKE